MMARIKGRRSRDESSETTARGRGYSTNRLQLLSTEAAAGRREEERREGGGMRAKRR